MKKKCTATTAIIFMCLFTACFCPAQDLTKDITIGVLAKNGKVDTLKQWRSTAAYLSADLNRNFTVVALEFKKVLPAVQKEKVNFFIVNPSLFVTAMVRYQSVPVVTMKAAGNDRFGGVIFTADANKSIHSITELKGKKFGAVAKTSLGGWQMAQKEFLDSGIELHSFVSTLRFFDTHTKVVKAVLDGQVDAGTVRTGVLERMAKQGDIKMTDIRMLAKKDYPGFPFVVSTALYPEWVLARPASTSRELADRVASSLKSMFEDDRAAVDARCTGWSDPWDYSGVEQLQKELRVGAYKEEN